MKLQVSNTNQPAWRNITVSAEIPKELKALEEMSKNLWWVWNSKGKHLFRELDHDLWRKVGENPVMLLQQLSYERYNEILADKNLMDQIADTYADFKAYMKVPMDNKIPSVAYFSMEYGLCNCLKIYSGGLGVLAGDYIKQASDSRVNMTAVGFLYKYGYFSQSLSIDGQQIANYESQNFDQLPIEAVLGEDGQPMILEVPYPGRVVYAHVWRVNVGRMKLYLLDTDLDRNSEWDREITHKLYGGDWENRIKQEYLLGIGGIIMLKKLGIKTQLYHCNEGHAALLNLQRLVDFVNNDHLPFNVALEMVRASSLYTVHTPVPAGHDYFEESLFGKYMGEFPAKLGISWSDLIEEDVRRRMERLCSRRVSRRLCHQRCPHAYLGRIGVESFLWRSSQSRTFPRPEQSRYVGEHLQCSRRRYLGNAHDPQEQVHQLCQERFQREMAQEPG